jgi:hypothetical protein
MGGFNNDEFALWPCWKSRLGSINLLLLFFVWFFTFKLIKDCFVVEDGIIEIYIVFLGFVLVKISWNLGFRDPKNMFLIKKMFRPKLKFFLTK